MYVLLCSSSVVSEGKYEHECLRRFGCRLWGRGQRNDVAQSIAHRFRGYGVVPPLDCIPVSHLSSFASTKDASKGVKARENTLTPVISYKLVLTNKTNALSRVVFFSILSSLINYMFRISRATFRKDLFSIFFLI